MKGSRLYIDLFKVFRDVAETKNFSRAAEQNYITQSAVSQQIAFLEEHFGKQLIIRRKGIFSLTQEGTIFLKACEDILQTY
ncbi:MAG: LysR family transcriptional regulator, partial [Candidatus Marinimicrobia bacterium]|nr:LysR family transcriptional regulator [Candidatus Neomarinimicrobiota bacterium]